MSFLNAAFLAALAAVAAPVVIHLIHRQRYPERRFTTLRFFDATIKHNVLRNRLVDRILLALRVAAVCLIALGLSRPFWAAGFGEQRRSVVLVVDNSPSMARTVLGRTLFDRAREAARRVLETLGATDRVALVWTAPRRRPAFTSDRARLRRELSARRGQRTALLVAPDARAGAGAASPASLGVTELTPDAARVEAALSALPAGRAAALVGLDERRGELAHDVAHVRRELDAADVSQVRGDVGKAVARAARLLARSRDGRRCILVLSDLQKADWSPSADALPGVEVAVAPVMPKAGAGANLGIASCSAEKREVGMGQSVMVTALVRNYGVRPSDPGELEAYCLTNAVHGARVEKVRLPAIPPGGATLARFRLRGAAGESTLLCTARVLCPSDPLAYDDAWHFQVDVRPPVRVLCVNGGTPAKGPDRETFYIQNALSPRAGAHGAGSLHILSRECDLEKLKDERLFEYGVIVLAGAGKLDAATRERLRRFVSDGGGMLVFPARDATPDEGNGWGLLPARILEAKDKEFVFVKSIAEKAPSMAGVAARAGALVQTLSTSARLLLEPGAGAQVLARFNDGSPALVEGRLGRGRVVLAAAGCHVSASDWPLRRAFVILSRHLVQWLGRSGGEPTLEPERPVGLGAAAAIPAELTAGTGACFRLAAQGPAYRYEPLPWLRSGERLVLPAAVEQGHYLLALRPGAGDGVLTEPGLGAAVTPVSVNHDVRESDLSALRAEDVPGRLRGARVTVTKPDEPVEAMLPSLGSGRELWRWLLLAGLATLVAEGLIGWRCASESAAPAAKRAEDLPT